MGIEFKCLRDSLLFENYLSLSSGGTDLNKLKFSALEIVHKKILPVVLSNMICNRGKDIELKGVQDWVTQTDKDNQIATVIAFKETLPEFHHIGEEETTPPVSKIVTVNHLRENTIINDGVDGTSFFAYKNENIFGPLSFIVPDYREFAYQITILFSGNPIYAGIFAPALKLDGTNDISILEAVDGFDGTWLNGSRIYFSSGDDLKGSKPLLSFINAPYKDSLTNHLVKSLELRSYYPIVSSVSCETALLINRSPKDNITDYSFALYSPKTAKIWDWLPGAFLVEKSGGVAALIKRDKTNGFTSDSLFPVTAENLVPIPNTDTFAPAVKYPVIYGSKEVVNAILSAMNDWPDKDIYFPKI